MNNSFGKIYRFTTFGESHGNFMGGIVDGVPANYLIDIDEIQKDLDKRKPGTSEIATQRKEEDKIQILSGIFQGKTTGAPIGFIIENTNKKSTNYNNGICRPSHADFTYQQKYYHVDYRGGGRSSARETVCRVVAGSIAKQIIKQIYKDIEVFSYTSQIGFIELNKEIDLSIIYNNDVRCPDTQVAQDMTNLIKIRKEKGDSVGGKITTIINNLPTAIGEPVYNKLQAELGYGMLSIPAVKGFEYGSGFDFCKMYGHQSNDEFCIENNKVVTKTNNSGGIQGGISNSMPIYFNVAIKPTPSIFMSQNTIKRNVEKESYDKISYKIEGRHDPCIVPRAVPVVEGMTWIVLLDQIMQNNTRNF